MEDEDVYWGMVLGAAELLGNGITTTTEQYRHPDAVARGVLDAGIRAVYTPAIFDVPGTGDTWEALLEGACRLFDEMEGKEERLRIGFGPHARTRCRPRGWRPSPPKPGAGMRCCRSISPRPGPSVPWCASATAPARRSCWPATACSTAGSWPRTPCGSRTAICPCWPSTTSRWPTARAPTASSARAWRRWPTTSSEGCASVWAPTARPRTTISTSGTRCASCALLARATAADPSVVSTRTALRLATRGGADALGLPVGSLEVGRRADVIHLRTDDPRFTPATSDDELLGHLVWAGAGYLVTDVWVSGERVVERRPLHALRRGAGEGRGGPARPSTCRLVGSFSMPGFVDQAQLHARAGDGGAGAVSWRREAHVDRGGPDGGDGGHGGDVWLVASVNESSLLGFRDHPFRRATNGVHGSGGKRHGARGKDLEVPVPVGTVVHHRDGRVLCDLASAGSRWPGRRRRPRGAGERAVPVQPTPGAGLRRAGGEGRGVLARHGTQAHG